MTFPKSPEPEKPAPPPPDVPPPLQFRRPVIPMTQFGTEDATALYERLLDQVTFEIFMPFREGETPAGIENIRQGVASVAERLQKGDSSLLYLASTRATPDYYLHAHAVNNCILALWVGIGLGYSQEQLVSVGISALIHDVGMIPMYDMVKKATPLSPEERERLREHPDFSAKFLQGIRGIPEPCLRMVQSVHERYNGQGYPLGLKRSGISEESQCVAVCDVYAAMIHPRFHREGISPHGALKNLLKEREGFHPRVLKYFIQQVTLFPVGSWVELCTGAVGEVISTSPKLPLQPTVKVLFDWKKKLLDMPKVIDLSQEKTISVRRGLENSEIQRDSSVFGGR